MIELKTLWLKKFVVYRDLTWQMNRYPLVVIRGRNEDRRSRSPNAVGKSLLASAITNLILEAPPITVKKKAVKDLVHSGAKITLELTNNKTNWALTQFAKGKSVNYTIFKDGKSLEAHRIDTARKFIHQAMPFTEDQLYSQFYISSYRPSVLLIGSASRRFEYFENVFSLQIYDMMRKALLRDLQQVNSKFSQQQLLQRQREELRPRLGEDLTARIKKIRHRHQTLLNNYRRSNEQAQQLIAYVTLAEQVASNATRQELHHKKIKQQQQLHKLQQRHRRLQRRLGAARQSAKIWRSRRKLHRRLARLPPIQKLSPNNELAELLPKITKLEQQINLWHRYEPYIAKYCKIIGNVVGVKPLPVNKLQQQFTELSYRLRQRRKLRGGKRCPVCGKRVNRAAHRHTLTRWQRQQRQLHRQITLAKQIEFCHKLETKLPKKLIQLSANPMQQLLDKYRQKQKKLQRASKLIKQRKTLQQRLHSLPQVKRITPINRQLIQRLERRIDVLRQSNQQITSDLILLDKILELQLPYDNLVAAQRALAGLQATISKISPMLQKITDRMHRFSAQQSEYRAASKQLTEIEYELSIIDQVVENRDILEALVAAYSSKGIRVMQVSALANAYINALNTLAPTIYAERYKFHADISNNKFDILAERHSKISDVRALSGSESRQFLCISAPAGISLMPDDLRCNMMMLDEVESGLAIEERRLFTQEFIPMLASSISNVVIITPQSIEDMPIIGAKELLLVRRNGQTSWSKQ